MNPTPTPSPQDLEVERNVLGGMMLAASHRDAVLSQLQPEFFYHPENRRVYEAIVAITGEGLHASAGVVHHHLNGSGPGREALDLWVYDAPDKTTLISYTDMLRRAAAYRRRYSLLVEAKLAMEKGGDADPFIAQLSAEQLAIEDNTGWEIGDFTSVAGTPQLQPEWLRRTDGACLLYPGKVHAFNGESESGKTWLACVLVAEAVTQHRRALYLDFEDDIKTFHDRLRGLNVSLEEMCFYVHHVRPEGPLSLAASARLDQWLKGGDYGVAVIDGVAEALSMNAWDENKASDVMAFYEALPRRIARTGAATVLIDHLVKDKEAQGRYGRGSTAKLAGVDGAVYKVETITPFGRGLTGKARLVIAKDRHGAVRRIAAGQKVIAEMVMTSSDDGERVDINLAATGEGFVPTRIMAAISEYLERHPDDYLTFRQIMDGVPLRHEKNAKLALEHLYEASCIDRKEPRPGQYKYRHVNRYHDPVGGEE